MRQVVNRIRGLFLPDEVERSFPGVRVGFELIADFQERRGDGEALARQFLLWVAERGPAHGLRFPRPDERARALGLGDFFDALQLDPRQLHDVVGGHFDPRALKRRMFPLLRDWHLGRPVSTHAFPDPSALNGIYSRLRAGLRQAHPLIVPVRDPQGGFAPLPVRQALAQLGLWDVADFTAMSPAAPRSPVLVVVGDPERTESRDAAPRGRPLDPSAAMVAAAVPTHTGPAGGPFHQVPNARSPVSL